MNEEMNNVNQKYFTHGRLFLDLTKPDCPLALDDKRDHEVNLQLCFIERLQRSSTKHQFYHKLRFIKLSN